MPDKNETIRKEGISLLGAISIGVGGMVGGGIFAVLGLAATLAGGATFISFIIAGVVAILTAYSYAKLSVAYPSQGGTIIFIDKAFGISLLTGATNNLLWLGYIITLALYAVAFGNYATTFFPQSLQINLIRHSLISMGIIFPTLLNLLSAEFISKIETYIVTFKIALLIVIIGLGLSSIDTTHLQPRTWEPLLQIVSAGMIIFVAYEGFELIANTADDINNYKKNLPLAFYISIIFVVFLYVIIAIVVVGSLDANQISAAQDFALAEAAKPALGQLGFTIVGVAAILATLSAINSTLYGSARLSYTIACEGELPSALEKKVWGQPIGLLITAGLALALANSIDLSSISIMGSASFLIIFAIVNLSNYVESQKANSSKAIASLGVFACVSALLTLIWHTIQNNPNQLWVLIGLFSLAFIIEGIYYFFLKKSGQVERIFQSGRSV